MFRTIQDRPSKDEWFKEMALLVSRRSTCHRLAVGCVLVNSRGHVLSTGYNGVAAGLMNCNQSELRLLSDIEREANKAPPGLVAPPGGSVGWVAPPGAKTAYYPHRCANSDAPLGQPNGCESIHAEQNALLQCRDVYAIEVAYVTHSPCLTCVKLLLNTGCRRIVWSVDYPSGGAEELWTRAGREWIQIP